MIKKVETIKDISIMLDMVFTMFAVAFQNAGNSNLSNLFFAMGGFGLVLAFLCVIVTLVMKLKNK